MSTIRKKQIFKAMKFRTLKSAKFYSREIKRVYSNYNDQQSNCLYIHDRNMIVNLCSLSSVYSF